MIILLAVRICSLDCAGNEATNHLAIHLLSQKVSRETLRAGKPEGLELASQPVLSDADFVSYDNVNHVFVISAESAKRLSMKLTGHVGPTLRPTGNTGYLRNWRDTPFVLVADGERIYLGIFSTSNSSTIYSRLPTVFPTLKFGPADSTNSVRFRIELFNPRLDAQGPGADVRSDQRILEALKKLGLKP